MAAVQDVQTVNITIDGVDLVVPKGELIVESAKRIGLEIPIFCYHPRMKPVGMCRMCLVEIGTKQPDGTVRKMPKPQASCTLPASEGLVIYTSTDSIHKDRKGVLEFLLANHPLDCPICDRGGECPLQNNTLFYGPSTSRFVDLKRHAPKAFPLSKHVTLDLERCIQCGRCVRFTEEISGDSQLAFRFRGADMQPSTYELSEFDSKFSGNVIEICPVGALTSTQYRFRARPWDLETKPGICTLCSNGCNIWVDHRAEKIVRINGRTNESINEEWTCDRGKFGHDFYNSPDRQTEVLMRVGDKFEPATWSEAYRVLAKEFVGRGDEAAILLGPQLTNEDLAAFKIVASDIVKTANIDFRFEIDAETEPLPPPITTISDLESSAPALVFATSLADDLPMFFLRLRKGWSQHGKKVVVAFDRETEVDEFADVSLIYYPGTGRAFAEFLNGSRSAAETSQMTGISIDNLERASEILNVGAAQVVCSRNALNEVGELGLKTLASWAAKFGVIFNVYPTKASYRGAKKVGFGPSPSNLGTKKILEACSQKAIRALWLVGVDPLDEFADRELARAALENVEFLVYQGATAAEAAGYASLCLPQTAPAEQGGRFISADGQLQVFQRVLSAKGSARPAWKIASEFAMRSSAGRLVFDESDLAGHAAGVQSNATSTGSPDAMPLEAR